MAVQGLEEVRHLLGRLGIHDPSEARRPALAAEHSARVGDHPDRHSVQPAREADHLGGALRLELVRARGVEDTGQDLAHVIGLAVIDRQDVVELGRLAPGNGGPVVAHRGRLVGEIPDEIANPFETGLFVVHAVVRDATDLDVHARAAELLRVDGLPRGSLDEVGAAQTHEGGAFDHQNDVG